MKKLQVFVVLLSVGLIFLSCKKDEENEEPTNDGKLVSTSYKGCFIAQNPTKGVEGDSIYHSFSGDTLIMNVVVNYNCCGELVDSVVVRGEELKLYIKDACIDTGGNCECFCMCDFEFEYTITDFISGHVEIYLQGLNETAYSLWDEYVIN